MMIALLDSTAEAQVQDRLHQRGGQNQADAETKPVDQRQEGGGHRKLLSGDALDGTTETRL